MNILIVSDSHKDFASSNQVGKWIAEGVSKSGPNCDIKILQQKYM